MLKHTANQRMLAGAQGFIKVGSGSRAKCEQCCESFTPYSSVNCGNLCATSQRDCNNSMKSNAKAAKLCPASDACCGDEFADYDEYCYM